MIQHRLAHQYNVTVDPVHGWLRPLADKGIPFDDHFVSDIQSGSPVKP